jgi:plasmid stability protein
VTDIVVRDVPDDVVAALDARASRLGLSRSEFLRRRLAREALEQASPVTVADLDYFASTFADLGDSEVMKGAWE